MIIRPSTSMPSEAATQCPRRHSYAVLACSTFDCTRTSTAIDSEGEEGERWVAIDKDEVTTCYPLSYHITATRKKRVEYSL
jgi:hypothetical protein